jgi:hypothetical protein
VVVGVGARGMLQIAGCRHRGRRLGARRHDIIKISLLIAILKCKIYISQQAAGEERETANGTTHTDAVWQQLGGRRWADLSSMRLCGERYVGAWERRRHRLTPSSKWPKKKASPHAG